MERWDDPPKRPVGRPPNTEDRRRQIARGMMEAIAHGGYERATIADAALFAGLTPGLVHYHFESKLEILLEVLKELSEAHLTALNLRLAAAGRSQVRRLEAFVDAHLELRAGKPALTVSKRRALSERALVKLWMTISNVAMREPKVGRAYGEFMRDLLDRLEEILIYGRDDGVFACRDPKAPAAAILAAILGCFELDAAAPAAIPGGTAAESVKRMAAALAGVRRRR